MDVYKAVRTVLAVRQYQDKPVPPEVVHRILAAAHLTASSMNQQPWRFILVDDREMLKRLAEAAHTGPYIAGAALAVVVVVENTRFAVSDGSRAIQDMILTAWEEGVGSNWVGFIDMEAVKPLLGIPPEMKVLSVVPFGYPAKKVGQGHKNRKPFNEVVFHGQFGAPYKP